jgi:D-xylose transport system substrate-binding protein
MIEGDPYNDNARNLAQGVYDELRLFPELKLVADQPCPGWSRELAGELAKTMLQDFGNQLDALIVANDDMAGAVTEVLQAEQLAGKILLVGGDGDLDALERIRTGVQHGTTFQNWINLAEETLRFAIEVARGQVNHTQFKRESIFFNPPGPAVYVKHLPYIFIDRSNLDILENFWVEAMRKAMPDLLPDLAKTVRLTRGV